MTCIHATSGLCEKCEAEYAADPSAWIEFGEHEQGIANWNKFLAELSEQQQAEEWAPVIDWADVPL